MPEVVQGKGDVAQFGEALCPAFLILVKPAPSCDQQQLAVYPHPQGASRPTIARPSALYSVSLVVTTEAVYHAC